jgi:hypothetical protein
MTAELLARCRAALQASDETAQAVVHTEERVFSTADGYGYRCDCGHKDVGYPTELDAGLWSDNHVEFASTPADEKQLAWVAALRTVLDGIEATLVRHAEDVEVGWCCMSCPDQWPCMDYQRATASLAAIASALGVQEADRG